MRIIIYTFLLWVINLKCVSVSGSRCFKFQASSEDFAVFNVESQNVENGFHYRFKFRTIETDVLLFYTEGPHSASRPSPYDYEALFIRNDHLHYFAFNPTPYGVGQSYGAHLQTNFAINATDWMEVDFFRNRIRNVTENEETRTVVDTGMIVDGHEFVAEGIIQKMELGTKIWLGGHTDMDTLSSSLNSFDGEIKDFYDVNRDELFDRPRAASRFTNGTCA